MNLTPKHPIFRTAFGVTAARLLVKEPKFKDFDYKVHTHRDEPTFSVHSGGKQVLVADFTRTLPEIEYSEDAHKPFAQTLTEWLTARGEPKHAPMLQKH
jgi:hypothetical protein